MSRKLISSFILGGFFVVASLFLSEQFVRVGGVITGCIFIRIGFKKGKT